MDFYSAFQAITYGVHVLSAIVWLGGLIFLVGVLFPFRAVDTSGSRSVFGKALIEFRPYLYGSIGLSAVTGIWRIIERGGMGGVSPVIHIKIALVLVMVVLCIVSYQVFLPKMQANTKGDKVTTAADHALKGLVWCLGVAGVMGVAAVLVLAFGGYFSGAHNLL